MLITSSTAVFAQFKVGDNQGIINPSAALEVESTTKGILIPRMTTAQIGLIASPANGLMVYSTTDDCVYVYRGALGWKSTCNANDLGMWGLLGNTGNLATHFLGTTDAKPLILKTNNVEAMRIDPTGKIGIGGVAAPLYLIDVNSTADPIRLAGILSGAASDSVMTINAAGVVKKRSVASILAGALSANNGLNVSNNTVKLGGTLLQNTTIDQSTFNLAFTGTTGNLGVGVAAPTYRLDVSSGTNPLRLQGLVSGASPDSIMTIDAGGVVRQRSVASILKTGNSWLNGGNALTAPGTLGTTTNQPFSIITNNAPILTFGNTGTITQVGTSQVTFTGNVDATQGLDVTGAQLTANAGATVTGTTNINTTGATATNIGNATSTTTVTGTTNINTTGATATNIGNAGNTTNIAGNTLNITNLPSGTATDSVLVVDPTTGRVKKVTVTSIGANSFTVNNGLTKLGSNVQLGGTLIKNTDVALSGFNTTFTGTGSVGIGAATPTNKLHVTAAANPVRFEGLQAGASADSLVTTDPNGVLRKRTVASVVAGGITADNGLTKTGNNIQLGGTLTQNTTVNQATNNVSFVGGNVSIGAATPTSTLSVTDRQCY